MDMKHLATKMLLENINGANDTPCAEAIVGDLLGGTNEYDLTETVDKFLGAGGDIAAKTHSWLGNLSNQSLSVEEVESTIAIERIDKLASVLNVERRIVSKSLSKMLPELIDMSSRSGHLFWEENTRKTGTS